MSVTTIGKLELATAIAVLAKLLCQTRSISVVEAFTIGTVTQPVLQGPRLLSAANRAMAHT